ncbi:hypothetical protein [Acetomicrobium sp.]|nr:hypothetical protein [Acetomicrobium sp.]
MIKNAAFGGTAVRYLLKQESTGETWPVSELGRPIFSPGCAVSLEPKV